MILASLMSGGSLALPPNLQAQESSDRSFDVDAAIEAHDYSALAKYYRGLADEQRDIAEEYHRKLQERSYGYGRGGQYYWETYYRDLHYEALEKAEEYEALVEKYEKMMDEK